MSQRDSGYERKERDLYETPEWVTEALLPHLPTRGEMGTIWEPACASGKMSKVLETKTSVYATDVEPSYGENEPLDFLSWHQTPVGCRAIVTNPPYELGTEFCEHAVRVMQPVMGFVAMLMRTDFDHAKTRSRLFCHPFAKKLVLTKRIMWFEPESGAKGKSPSFNHAWFIWDWMHQGAPTLAYGP